MNTRFITEEEAKAMKLVRFGKPHPVRGLLESLEKGEIARISRSDFRWKGYTVNYLVKQVAAKFNRKFTIVNEAGRTGWIVTRVE